MRVIVTAGPTREHLDPVRFISNASSGRMGLAVARAAAAADCDVTVLCGPIAPELRASVESIDGVSVVDFVNVDDLHAALLERFDACDALVMAAAVGDFRPEHACPRKLHRTAGPIVVRLCPTEDILGDLKSRKRPDQRVIAFAVEDGTDEEIERKVRGEMSAKGADWTVVNTPAAIAADASRACILSPDGVVAPWADRTKSDLAEEIVKLLF